MSTKRSFNPLGINLSRLCCRWLSLRLNSETFSALSMIAIFQSSIPLCLAQHPVVSRRVKVTVKLFLIGITFLGINFWHFSSPTFIIIRTATERCNRTTLLLRTWFTLNYVHNQIGTTVQNPFSNVKCFTFILVLESFSFLNKRTNLESRPKTRRTFIIWRWFTFNFSTN